MNSLRIILQDLRYFAPIWVFASINILMGTWVLYIPYVKSKFDLNDAELGIALFCYAFGILIMIPLITTINRRLGVGRFTIIGITLFAISFTLPLWTPSYEWLCISLFFVGLCSGSTDISMNALVSEIETRDNVRIMSAAHGFFSLGAVLGAGLGSFFLLEVLTPRNHILLISLIIIGTNLMLSRNYYNIIEKEEQKEKAQKKLSNFIPLAVIAFIAFAIMGSEGAIENWSKLYLLEVIEVRSDKIAGYGFVLFSTTMTLGRFFGDGISIKYGSDNVIVGGSLIAVIAHFGILSGDLIISLVGFGVLGLGLSVIIPELFRIAGKSKSISPSAGIAFVSGIGFVGFLIGPVVLGLISNLAGLKVSFVALLFITIIASILGFLRKTHSGAYSVVTDRN